MRFDLLMGNTTSRNFSLSKKSDKTNVYKKLVSLFKSIKLIRKISTTNKSALNNYSKNTNMVKIQKIIIPQKLLYIDFKHGLFCQNNSLFEIYSSVMTKTSKNVSLYISISWMKVKIKRS